MSSIERRAYLRHKLAIPVRFENDEGVYYDSETMNISLGGFQADVTGSIFHRLLPEGIQTSPADQVELNITLQPEGLAMQLVGRVQGVARIAESTYSIRMSFINLDQQQRDQLQTLLTT